MNHRRASIAHLAVLALGSAAAAQGQVTLSAFTMPATGVAGAGTAAFTVTGLPATLNPGQTFPIQLSLAGSCFGSGAVTASGTLSTGTNTIVSFQLPASLAQGPNFVWFANAGGIPGGPYSSTNCASVTVTNPAAVLTPYQVQVVYISSGAPASAAVNGNGAVALLDDDGIHAASSGPIYPAVPSLLPGSGQSNAPVSVPALTGFGNFHSLAITGFNGGTIGLNAVQTGTNVDNVLTFSPLGANFTNSATVQGTAAAFNDKGQIAYFAPSPTNGGIVQLVEQDSTGATRVLLDNGTTYPQATFRNLAMNDNGDVALTLTFDDGSPGVVEYQAATGFSVVLASTSVDALGGSPFTFGGSSFRIDAIDIGQNIGINLDGHVVFKANYNGGAGIFVAYPTPGAVPGTLLSQIDPIALTVMPGAAFTAFDGEGGHAGPAIDDLNVVAFYANTSGSSDAASDG